MLSELGKNVPCSHAETWGKNELVYYFLSELKFHLEPEKIGTVFKQLTNIYINPIFKRYNFEERSGVCYTIRKSHWHKNPINFYKFYEPVFNIPHDFQHTEVAEYFNTYKMFISYDPCTFLTIMAALCGCISVVYPQDNLTKKEWLKTTAAADYFESKDSTDLYGVAYGMEDLQFAIDTIHLVKEQWEDIQQFKIKNTVIPFINDINNFENMPNTLQNNFYKT
jgi:hypothetical protein